MATDDSTFDPFHLIHAGSSPPNESLHEIYSAGTNESSYDASLDPFGIAKNVDRPKGSSSLGTSVVSPPFVTRVNRTSGALPPKLVARLTIYEEVSSVASTSTEGSSNVSIEGSIFAQVQCSDALKNAPFKIVSIRQSVLPNKSLKPNPKYAALSRDNELIVNVPKSELSAVLVAHYSLSQQVEHMPLLLERKATVTDKSIRIAVQVRSKLTNVGDLEDFTVAVAVPEKIDGQSVKVLRGSGTWDSLQRLIKWKVPTLTKGKSFMLSAQANLWKELAEGEHIHFPVLLRCTSTADQISTADFDVEQTKNYSVSLTTTKARSFRLLHRLPTSI